MTQDDGLLREIADLVDIATLGDGVLHRDEEHRIVKLALARGLSPRETQEAIDAALSSKGSAREAAVAAAPVATASGNGAGAPATPAPAPAPAPVEPEPVRAPRVIPIHDPVAKVIARRMGKRGRPSSASLDALPPTAPPAAQAVPAPVAAAAAEEVLVPEVVAVAPEPVLVPVVVAASPGVAQPVEAASFVCTACLAVVALDDVNRGAAERLLDGRVHCRRCTSKLVGGNLCGACYRAVARADLEAGRAAVRGDRVVHLDCNAPRADPQAAVATPATGQPRPPVRATTPAGGSPILGASSTASPLGSSSTYAALGGGGILQGGTGSGEKLGAKCSGCHIALPNSAFREGRAYTFDGQSFCPACARRAGRIR